MTLKFHLISVGALLAGAVACSQGDRPGAVSATPSTSPSGGVSAPMASTTIPPTFDSGPPKALSHWRTVPTGDAQLHVVTDGLCSELAVYPAGDKAFVTYGGTQRGMARDKPPEKREGRGTLAIFSDVLSAEGAPHADNLVDARSTRSGIAWAVEDTSGRSEVTRQVHIYAPGKGWSRFTQYLSTTAVGILLPWTGGGMLWVVDDFLGEGKVRSTFERDDKASPAPPNALVARTQKDQWEIAAETHPESSTVVTALPDDGRITLRTWTAPGPMTSQVLSIKGVSPKLALRSATEGYLSYGSALARWDGKTWKVVGTAGSSVTRLVTRSEGGVLVLREDGKLESLDSSGSLTTIATPEPVETLASEGDKAWITGKSGSLFKKEGERFTSVPVPAPAFGVSTAVKARDVRIAPDGTVYVIAKYWEKGLDWAESELHWALLSSRKPKETVRCNEPDPENNNLAIGTGLQSWPPRADDSCKEPFVVIARRSNATKAPSTWKAITSKLGAADGGGTRFVEFTSGDRTFLGAAVASVAAGHDLAKRAAKGSRLRPELVCGAPDAPRPLTAND